MISENDKEQNQSINNSEIIEKYENEIVILIEENRQLKIKCGDLNIDSKEQKEVKEVEEVKELKEGYVIESDNIVSLAFDVCLTYISMIFFINP